jgi:hypothetical protein
MVAIVRSSSSITWSKHSPGESSRSVARHRHSARVIAVRYTPLLCRCNDFNAYGVFGRDRFGIVAGDDLSKNAGDQKR